MPVPLKHPPDIVLLDRKVPPALKGFFQVSFEVADIQLLSSPTAWLNDICLNGCIPVLSADIHPVNADHFAIFSTFDLHRIRYNASDHVLWQTMKHTSFWTKSVWIIPIHRSSGGGHWVLCVAQIEQSKLMLFDSLGEQRPWRTNVQVSPPQHTPSHWLT